MSGSRERPLLVIADGLGLGPSETRGILPLARQGVVTGASLLVNLPFAAESVRLWRLQGSLVEIGWQANLTLDRPAAPLAQVPSLVQTDGSFWPIDRFLRRWFLGLFDRGEIELELRQQLDRFVELIGYPPLFVNFHQHIGLLTPIGEILVRILAELRTKPYVRRVQEPLSAWRRLPGRRWQRALVSMLGHRLGRLQEAEGFPGNDWLADVADLRRDTADAFARRLRAVPSRVVELMCHPSLAEQHDQDPRWLSDPTFLDAVQGAGFRLMSPSETFLGLEPPAQVA